MAGNSLKKYIGFILLLVLLGGSVIYFLPDIYDVLGLYAFGSVMSYVISAIMLFIVIYVFVQLLSNKQGARN